MDEIYLSGGYPRTEQYRITVDYAEEEDLAWR